MYELLKTIATLELNVVSLNKEKQELTGEVISLKLYYKDIIDQLNEEIIYLKQRIMDIDYRNL